MEAGKSFESGDVRKSVLGVPSTDNPAELSGNVETAYGEKGCSVDGIVLPSQETVTTRFVRSRVGRIPLPFFDIRLGIAVERAVVKTENAADLADIIPTR